MAWPLPGAVELAGHGVRLSTTDPAADARRLFVALDHDAVWTHLAGRADTPERLAASLAVRQADPTWHVWTVWTGDQVVGTTSFHEASVPDARLEIGATAYTPEAWGTAVNPATMLALLTHAFEVLGAGRVQLKTDVRNTRSQRAIERLGATREGVLRRYQRRTDGTVRDTVLYAVVAEDWPRVRAGLLERLG